MSGRRLLLAVLGALLLAPSAARSAPSNQGEYLTRAADCEACHTMPGAPGFTGGRAFNLPFGVLYAPNITPDADTGIGRYSDDEWVRMMQTGVARDGKHLYPAMPYAAYSRMSREDALAIKAYLFSLPAVHAPPPENRIRFPFNQRWGMIFWNTLYNPGQPFRPDSNRPPEWNRGAYLVDVLGHCGECHTPRNILFGLKSDKAYAGTVVEGWHAYNLTPDRQHGLGAWTDEALAQYLSTGHAEGHGPASGPMAEAVEDSLRYLTPEDIHAMIVYLRSLPPQPDGPSVAAGTAAPAAENDLGARVFAQACAGCHLPDGAGRQSPWAALGGAHSAKDPASTNVLRVLAEGTRIDTPQGPMFMHGFTRSYTDAELAAVANYVAQTFGTGEAHVTAERIRALRSGGS